jgi:hypothetical protein
LCLRSRPPLCNLRTPEAPLSGTAFPDVHQSGVPYGQLHDTSCKEQISIAYAQAVTSAARCSLENIRVDYQGIDATIRQSAQHDLLDTVSLDVQLKCTASGALTTDHLAFSLDKAKYDKLRNTRRLDDAILIVMLVPPNLEAWLKQSHSTLELAHAAYWVNLRGMPDIGSAGSTTVHLPRTNLFNVEQLLGMLARIGSGGHA